MDKSKLGGALELCWECEIPTYLLLQYIREGILSIKFLTQIYLERIKVDKSKLGGALELCWECEIPAWLQLPTFLSLH